MQFEKKLELGQLIKRYKRFLADIHWNGAIITAHVPNTGSLATALFKDQNCLFSISDDPHRKLKYTLELVQAPSGVWIGINTSNPNKIVKETLSELINPKEPDAKLSFSNTNDPWARWSEFDEFKPEIKISKETRLDFGLRKKTSDKWHYIEVKNVTMVNNSCAQFPDAVTERGQKHIREMINLVDLGHSAELLFVVQRNDVTEFSPARHIDAEYARWLEVAIDKGVVITPLLAEVSPDSITLTQKQLPLLL